MGEGVYGGMASGEKKGGMGEMEGKGFEGVGGERVKTRRK